MKYTADNLPEDSEQLKHIVLHAQRMVARFEQDKTQLEQRSARLEKSNLRLERHRIQLEKANARLVLQNANLIEQLLLKRHSLFGSRSEKTPSQGELFNEAESLHASGTEADAANVAAAESASSSPAAPRRAPGGRKPLPAELPRIDRIHALPEHELICICGCQKQVIGEDVSEQLDIIPLQIRVIRHVRPRYACACGESAPVTALLPPQPIPKSNAAPGLLAMLLTTKYVDGTPLHRFEKVLSRHGVEIPRQTLARWVIQGSAVLQPLVNLMRDQLGAHDVIHCDETVVQVLKEPDKSAQSQSYMWVQSGGPPDRPVVLFDYAPSRSGRVATRLLEGFSGYLMSDGYDGYNAAAAAPGVVHLACWAHARRRFIEAQRVQPRGKTGKADVGVNYIARLYGIEKTLSGLPPEERTRIRQEKGSVVLGELRAWLDKDLAGVPPQSKLGEAMRYLDKYWTRLVRYTERGDLPLDNNRAENAIRPFVIGRKNWLFADTPKGASASAVIYSLIETAKGNGHEPYAYLRQVLTALPSASTLEAVEQLLPWNLNASELMDNALR